MIELNLILYLHSFSDYFNKEIKILWERFNEEMEGMLGSLEDLQCQFDTLMCLVLGR